LNWRWSREVGMETNINNWSKSLLYIQASPALMLLPKQPLICWGSNKSPFLQVKEVRNKPRVCCTKNSKVPELRFSFLQFHKSAFWPTDLSQVHALRRIVKKHELWADLEEVVPVRWVVDLCCLLPTFSRVTRFPDLEPPTSNSNRLRWPTSWEGS